eukprot:4385982-Amphidinium_carterae.1
MVRTPILNEGGKITATIRAQAPHGMNFVKGHNAIERIVDIVWATPPYMVNLRSLTLDQHWWQMTGIISSFAPFIIEVET